MARQSDEMSTFSGRDRNVIVDVNVDVCTWPAVESAAQLLHYNHEYHLTAVPNYFKFNPSFGFS